MLSMLYVCYWWWNVRFSYIRIVNCWENILQDKASNKNFEASKTIISKKSMSELLIELFWERWLEFAEIPINGIEIFWYANFTGVRLKIFKDNSFVILRQSNLLIEFEKKRRTTLVEKNDNYFRCVFFPLPYLERMFCSDYHFFCTS